MQGTEEHSDVETSTASEGSSGGAPWTVVTSPRKGAQDEEVTSPPKAEETAPAAPASAMPVKSSTAQAAAADPAGAAIRLMLSTRKYLQY